MAKIKHPILIILFVSVNLFFGACTDTDNEENPTDPREKFLGNWKVTETVNGQNTIYNSKVENNPANSSEILIRNIYDLGNTHLARALVNGNSLTLPNQPVSGFEIQGNGIYQNGNFTLTYTVNEGNGPLNVTALHNPI